MGHFVAITNKYFPVIFPGRRDFSIGLSTFTWPSLENGNNSNHCHIFFAEWQKTVQTMDKTAVGWAFYGDSMLYIYMTTVQCPL